MSETRTDNAPLAGIRVIELARILAGPWAGQLLADLGADVIKIEHPEGGDDTRRWGPPFVEGADGENLSAAYYHSTNRGKRSITLDIASPEGAETARELISTADVVLENFKVGGLKKYGLDYDSLKAANPRLVYCSITGFGQTGPYAPRAGYDFIIQAMAGMMSITGEPGREPQKAGVAISDIFTGLYSVIAIQAALRHAEKTGDGPDDRHGAVRHPGGHPGQPEPQLPGVRRCPGADGQRPHEHRALRGVPGQRRPRDHRGRQ
jgi:crotonobetainyl-CoA:carnitine CoA-transferase CaiB-like acyl-CoA transferase